MVYSHPWVLLKDHLLKVAKFTDYYIWIFHDLWKATSYFQKRLNWKNEDWNHSILWSFFFYYFCLKNNFNEDYLLAWLLSILYHHSDLKYDSYLILSLDNNLKYIEIDDLFIKFVPIFNTLIEDKYKKLDIEEIKLDIINYKNRFKKYIIDKIRNGYKPDFFYLNKFYFSLVYADKYAIYFDNEIDHFLKIDIDYYIKLFKNKNKIDKYRREFYEYVNNRLKDYNNDKIVILQAPTWIWKTINLLKIAYEIHKKTNKRIIYVLPYISIIDQTYDVFNEILKKFNEDNNLARFHYSAEKKISNYQPAKDLFILDSLNKKISIITFVKFFNILLKNFSSSNISYNNLTESIIILDEVQAVPIEYLNFISYYFSELVNKHDCFLIFSSATMPLSNNWFNIAFNINLDRTYIDLSMYHDVSIEWLANFIRTLPKNKSILIVLNTIKSTIELFELLKEYNPLYLSSNLIPKHRKEVLKKIRSWKNILISTQVIEAWIDIDFDIWIRDIWPLDSIIQVAWRLNRNANKEISPLYVIKLNSWEDSKRVYWISTFHIVDEILLRYKYEDNHIKESKYNDLIKEYYQEKIEKSDQSISFALKEYLEKLNYEDLSKTFKLINNYEKLIFIEYDEYATNLIKEYKKILEDMRSHKWDLKEFFNKKAELLNLMPKIYDYCVSIDERKKNNYISYIKNDFRTNNIIWYVPNECVKEIYDDNYWLKNLYFDYIIW